MDWGGVKICKSSEENCVLKSQVFSKSVKRERRKKWDNQGETSGQPRGVREVVPKRRATKQTTESQGYKWNLYKAAWVQLTGHKTMPLLEHNSCFIWKKPIFMLFSCLFNRYTINDPLFSDSPILKLCFVFFELKRWCQELCLQRVCIQQFCITVWIVILIPANCCLKFSF